MAGQEDLDRVREQSDKAKDYFSKVPDYEGKSFEKPAPEAPAEEEEQQLTPPTRLESDGPLSDAEKYFKKLI